MWVSYQLQSFKKEPYFQETITEVKITANNAVKKSENEKKFQTMEKERSNALEVATQKT